MKIIASSLLAATAILTFSSCETVVVEPARPTTRTTTTEETIVRRPGTTYQPAAPAYQRPGSITTETEVRRY